MIHKLIRGTFLLTIAGLITRGIGFFYRIFLANTLGEKNLGIYQLIFPLYGICFTLYGASLQTTVSQLVAGKYKGCRKKVVYIALILSILIASILTLFLRSHSTIVATLILHEPATSHLLKILSTLFPFCAITSICSGYFYGIQFAHVPAIAQIIEQIIRVAFVFLLFITRISPMSCALCTWGLVLGEIASQIFCTIYFFHHKDITIHQTCKASKLFKTIVKQTLPLCGTRLSLALLTSLESILLPLMLTKFGLSRDDSIRLFGVITGIVIPFVLFPGTITNSLAVILLPEISKAKEEKNKVAIQKATLVSIKYSCMLGCVASSILLLFGTTLGTCFFNSENAGKLLTLTSVVCPFWYTSTTQTSIITGLSHPQITFQYTLISLIIRIFSLLTLTPLWGIYGYLFGFISSQIVLYLLCTHFLCQQEHIIIPLPNWLIVPFLAFVSILFGVRILIKNFANNPTIIMVLSCICAGILFLCFSIRLHYISKKDFSELES